MEIPENFLSNLTELWEVYVLQTFYFCDSYPKVEFDFDLMEHGYHLSKQFFRNFAGNEISAIPEKLFRDSSKLNKM